MRETLSVTDSDKLHWLLQPSGNFSTASALLGSRFALLLPLCLGQSLCGKSMLRRPKVSAFIWLLMRNAISTDDRIQALGFCFPSRCLSCRAPLKPKDALIFSFRAVEDASLWSFFAMALNIPDQSVQQYRIGGSFQTQYDIVRNSVALYTLW